MSREKKEGQASRIQANASQHILTFEWQDSGEPTVLLGCMLQNWRLDFPRYKEVSKLLQSSIKQAIIQTIIDEGLPVDSLDFEFQLSFPMDEQGSLN